MTDKEWKELCEWVKSLNDNSHITILPNKNIRFYGMKMNLEFDKDGCIATQEGYLLVVRRTPQQIKSIIENLL